MREKESRVPSPGKAMKARPAFLDRTWHEATAPRVPKSLITLCLLVILSIRGKRGCK